MASAQPIANLAVWTAPRWKDAVELAGGPQDLHSEIFNQQQQLLIDQPPFRLPRKSLQPGNGSEMCIPGEEREL